MSEWHLEKGKTKTKKIEGNDEIVSGLSWIRDKFQWTDHLWALKRTG